MKNQKILFPIAPTENSANGLKYAIGLAKIKNCELNIFNVSEKLNGKNEIPHKDIIQQESGSTLKHHEIIREGETSEQILKIIMELEPELIIMSPDIFNKGKKYFAESETGKVMAKTNCPLLIIPPNTEFRLIQHIVFAAEMSEDVIRSVQELLTIFRGLSPHLGILTFSDKMPTWHFKKDVSDIVQKIKNYTEYENISGNICDHQNIYAGIDLYAGETNTDLICLENDGAIFHNLFFNSSNQTENSCLLQKPILILPKYWEDMQK
ncbi:MAG: universal stress protein [Cytophagaceae bacterium]